MGHRWPGSNRKRSSTSARNGLRPLRRPGPLSGCLAAGLGGLVLAHPGLVHREQVCWGVLLLMAALACGEWIRNRDSLDPWRMPARVWLPVLVMVGASLLSAFLCPVVGWVALGREGGHVLLLWVGWRLVRSEGVDWKKPLAVALGGAALAGAYGFLQYLGRDPLAAATPYGDRVVSTFENPNYFGSYQAMLLPVGLACFLRAETRAARGLGLILVAGVYLGLLQSGSRGAWMAALAGALVVGVGWMFHLVRGTLCLRAGWLSALVLVVGSITWLLRGQTVSTPAGPVTMDERIRDSTHIVGEQARADYTVNHRYRIWQVTWVMIRQRPVLGQGPGGYARSFVRVRRELQRKGVFPVQGWNEYFDARFAHNEFLHLWAESGLAAVVGFAWLVAGVLIRALGLGFRRRREILWAWGAMGLVVVGLVHGLVSFPLQLPASGTVFWLTLGVLAALPTAARSDVQQGGVRGSAEPVLRDA